MVLPFANVGGDAEQDYFADGVTESLTTDLSRMAGMFVIGRNTAFTYKGKAVDLKQIGRDLGVRYILEGSVQRGGNRLPVNVQLINTETGITSGPNASTNPSPVSSTCRTRSWRGFGLVNLADGIEGARRRIELASSAVADKDFGIAFFCDIGIPVPEKVGADAATALMLEVGFELIGADVPVSTLPPPHPGLVRATAHTIGHVLDLHRKAAEL